MSEKSDSKWKRSRSRISTAQTPRDSNPGTAQGAGRLRIIAGRWRGRKLSVPDVHGLRPTGDRVRETLFNWLQADVAGARCLDLFAGSGALGFEALSRHAKSVVFIEPDAKAHQNLLISGGQLGIDSSDATRVTDSEHSQTVRHAEATEPESHFLCEKAHDVLEYWRTQRILPEFDLVFVDPPFEQACQWQILRELASGFLAHNALIYIEYPCEQPFPHELPAGCEIVREKTFGHVSIKLIRYSAADNG